jgi:prepilin-type N-terminal cleavage/methylation domain-containing protein
MNGGKNLANVRSRGFTLLEVMVVVILIGILTTLAYSSLVELIQINKAKEAARTIATFVERAVAEGKMRKNEVTITATGNTIKAEAGNPAAPLATIVLANGFSFANTTAKPDDCGSANANIPVTSEVRIGISGISGSACFVACNAGSNYCGGAVKTAAKNAFMPYLKRKNSNWEGL